MQSIEIYEVGPRDGFQSVKEYIPLESKAAIVDSLAAAGVRHIQLTSFVSPRAVPQMRDAEQLVARCMAKYPQVDFFALVPNLRGALAAYSAGLAKISCVVSLSESHNRANVNRSHEESLAELRRIRRELPGLSLCLDLATAFGCAFEGKKTPAEVAAFLQPYIDSGVDEVNLCDTVGMANPAGVRQTIAAVRKRYPGVQLQVHIHDTRNMGMVNTLAAIECGVDRVQSALGGLGGCPFAPGASGNLATEDLVFMLSEMCYNTGIDAAALVRAAKAQRAMIPGGVFSGHLQLIQDGSACAGEC